MVTLLKLELVFGASVQCDYSPTRMTAVKLSRPHGFLQALSLLGGLWIKQVNAEEHAYDISVSGVMAIAFETLI